MDKSKGKIMKEKKGKEEWRKSKDEHRNGVRKEGKKDWNVQFLESWNKIVPT